MAGNLLAFEDFLLPQKEATQLSAPEGKAAEKPLQELPEKGRTYILTLLEAFVLKGTEQLKQPLQQQLQRYATPEAWEYQLIFDLSKPVRIALQQMQNSGLDTILRDIGSTGGNGADYQKLHTLYDRIKTFMDKLPGEEQNLSLAARDTALIADELMPMDKATRIWLMLGAMLTDIGKYAYPEDMRRNNHYYRNRQNPIRRHPEIGFATLQYLFHFPRQGLPRTVSLMALLHHEQPDGKGYPFHLTGEQIPFAIEMLKAPDAFYAMTMRDDVGGRMSPEQAMAELMRCKGTQFDARVVDAYVPMLRERYRPQARHSAGQGK